VGRRLLRGGGGNLLQTSARSLRTDEPAARTGYGRNDAAIAAGRFIVSFFEWFGSMGEFCGKLARTAVSPP
jgi:hypothetical protein